MKKFFGRFSLRKNQKTNESIPEQTPQTGEILLQIHFPPSTECLDLAISIESTIGGIRAKVEELYGIPLIGTLTQSPPSSADVRTKTTNIVLTDTISLRELGLKNNDSLFHWWGNPEEQDANAGVFGRTPGVWDTTGTSSSSASQGLPPGGQNPFGSPGGPPPPMVNPKFPMQPVTTQPVTGPVKGYSTPSIAGGIPPPIIGPMAGGMPPSPIMTPYPGAETGIHGPPQQNLDLNESPQEMEDQILARVLEESRLAAEQEEAERRLLAEQGIPPPGTPDEERTKGKEHIPQYDNNDVRGSSSPSPKTVKLRFVYDAVRLNPEEFESHYLTFPLDGSFESMTIALRGTFSKTLPNQFVISYCGNKLEKSETPAMWKLTDGETLLIEGIRTGAATLQTGASMGDIDDCPNTDLDELEEID